MEITIQHIKASVLNSCTKLTINDYIYYKDIKEKIFPSVIKSYIGMSIEEIKEKYGQDEADLVYCSVSNGIYDPTKPLKIPFEPFKKIRLIDIEIIKNKKEYPYKYIIYLFPNIYSIAINKKRIFSFTSSQENITNKQIIQRTVDVLNNNYV